MNSTPGSAGMSRGTAGPLTLGLVVNPIAGMGGRPGLKGTDGEAILHLAEEAGVTPMAPALALQAMEELAPLRDRLLVLTAGGDMGENACRQAGLACRVVHEPGPHTTAEDTVHAAKAIRDEGVRLLLFAGGDGTARDIYRAVGSGFPALGIPAGVKIHSPVYGNSPAQAGRLAALFLGGAPLPLRQEEVLDLDEAALREDRIVTSLFGYLTVPYKATHLQNKKAPSPLGEEAARRAIGLDVADHMKEDVLYLLGPGTTTLAVAQALGLSGSLMGVDVIENRRMIARDVGETRLLELLSGREAVLVVTPTGGQGFLLGRGNQQLSPRVIREVGRENLLILCTEGKLATLGGRALLVYTGDEELDGELAGIYRVKSGYGMDLMVRVVRA